uniref:Uncharacterized protein n=1 Tax=Siphoviridae sp. ct91l7 TaxID=2826173 RepID=A0A8S5MWW9_9CAUD|nr:MAG TPA: hypothetical protein [Siphoviridae sp. ct91l7]DAZ67837.1 MAG TPA: hypothetical protein [Caudoviricetes sp.]
MPFAQAAADKKLLSGRTLANLIYRDYGLVA